MWQRCSSLDMDTFSLCLGAWYQALFDTRRSLSSGPGPDTSKQLAARDGYLTAVSQLKHVPALAGRRCIPLSLGMSPPLMIVVLYNF